MIRSANVSLTDRILYFPCILGRDVEYLPYLTYPGSDWLVLSYKHDNVSQNLLEGLLTIHCPDMLPDIPKLFREHRLEVESKLMDLLVQYGI